MKTIALINCFIFILLGGIHIYWLFGGSWGMNVAVPIHHDNNTRLFEPSKPSTLIVALGLFLFGGIDWAATRWIALDFPVSFLKYALLFIAVLFAIRCIGDFRYVGFSKRYKTSRFAVLDSRYYSPLCLFLALSHGILFILIFL